MIQLYSLDPDFRRFPPKHPAMYCACCQKEIKDTASAVKVTVDYGTWDVAEGWDQLPKIHATGPLAGKQNKELNNMYVGATCWKKMKKRKR